MASSTISRAVWAFPCASCSTCFPPHYDGIKAFSETDLTEDLKSIDAPTLVMQGDDDQIVPYKGAALLQVKLLKNATLKLYPGFPHGMLTTYSETINQDLLAFIKT